MEDKISITISQVGFTEQLVSFSEITRYIYGILDNEKNFNFNYIFFNINISNTHAATKWSKIYVYKHTDFKGSIFYFDRESLKIKGNIRYGTFLMDYSKSLGKLDGKDVNSSIEEKEFRCKEKRFTNIKVTFFSKNMGKGTPLAIDNSIDWEYVKKEKPLARTTFEVVCGK